MSQALKIVPTQDQYNRFGECETCSVDASSDSDQLDIKNKQESNGQGANSYRDQLDADSDLFTSLILTDTDRELNNIHNNENHKIPERAITMDSAQFLQSRDIDAYFQTDDVSDVSTQIFNEISDASLGQDIKFSVELSSGRTVNVHAKESSDKWVIGLHIPDSEFRDKLLRHQSDMSDSLYAGFGKKVEIDVT